MTIAAEEYNIVLSAGPWLFISRYRMSTTGNGAQLLVSHKPVRIIEKKK